MVTRIRYTRENGALVSKPLFNGRTNVVIHIFPETMTFQVTDVETKETIGGGTDTSLHALKKHVKNFLVGFGVKFQDEVRVKKGPREAVI